MVAQGEIMVADRAEHTEIIMPRSASEIRAQVNLIQEVMKSVMQESQHYGTIPGCGPKPTLLKPGAEKLALTFRLAPVLQIRRNDLSNGHREYEVTCALRHIPSGDIVGEGVGSCSTMESKYRYRGGSRKCPECGKETIIKGKQEYGGGWICFTKKGGCGAKFIDDDPAITGQPLEKVENPDIADTYNTVLKMAKKRAQVDAILTATAASDIFTQDIEDFMPNGEAVSPASESPQARLVREIKELCISRRWPEAKQQAVIGAVLRKHKVGALTELAEGVLRQFRAAIVSGTFDKESHEEIDRQTGEVTAAAPDAESQVDPHEEAKLQYDAFREQCKQMAIERNDPLSEQEFNAAWKVAMVNAGVVGKEWELSQKSRQSISDACLHGNGYFVSLKPSKK